MKYYEINVISSIKLKDDSEVTMHPTEGIPCILKEGKYYSPSIVWLEYHSDKSEINAEEIDLNDNGFELDEDEGFWLELDDEEEVEILDDIYDEEIQFRPLSEDEIQDLESDDDE